MFNYLSQIFKGTATRHYARVMAFAVFGVGGFIALGLLVPSVYIFAPTEYEENTEIEITASSSFARALPTRLIIPRIELDTTFVPPLGLNEDQTVSVPDSYEEVGWYVHGASPGEIGPSVILGHVDSYEGPAIFFELGKLQVGDEVFVERGDGTTATFVVTGSERVSQNNFPTLKVYGPINHAGLRLVTCTGIYNHGSLRYSHNLIVYAELKEE